MIKIMYYITKNNKIIFAVNNIFETRKEAEKELKESYKYIKTKNNIKDIKYESGALCFTDFQEGDFDEIHKFVIVDN